MTDLKKQAEANASIWNHRAESHLRTWYDLDRFKAGQNSLDEIQLAQNEGTPDHSDDTTYQSIWSLSEVVQALIGAGLGLEALDESPYTFYQRLPYMKKDEKNWWHIPNCDLPLMYTLKAVLP